MVDGERAREAAGSLRAQGARSIDVHTDIRDAASVENLVSAALAAGGLAYGVRTFGVVAYSEAMRADLEPEGIGVSTLCPGPIDTNLPASDRLRGGADRVGGFSEALGPFIRGA